MRAVATSVVVLALALAACGDGGDGDPEQPQPTVTVTVTETVTVTPSEPAPSPSPTSSPTGSPTEPTAGGGDPCEVIEPFGAGIAFIVVSNLSPGDTLEPGDTVEGCGNTFEAAYQWELLDGQGNRLAGDAGTMTCGNGCYGEFTFTADFQAVGSQQIGTLRVFETSAQDGSDVHVNAIPVLLEP